MFIIVAFAIFAIGVFISWGVAGLVAAGILLVMLTWRYIGMFFLVLLFLGSDWKKSRRNKRLAREEKRKGY